MFFEGLADIWRPLLAGSVAYVWLIAVLRVSGKRTLAQMNAFDFIVTVAFGSTLATVLLSSDVSIVEGSVALASLALFQFVMAFISVRWKFFGRLIRADASYLVKDGHVLEDTLKKQRTNNGVVLQAIREKGVGSVDEVAAVILETNGKLSVITKDKRGDGSALRDVPSP